MIVVNRPSRLAGFGLPGFAALAAPVLMASLLLVLSGCGNGSAAKDASGGGGKVELVSIDLGRLVDVYAYQRIDPAVGDRRLRTNRNLVKVASNVVVNPRLGSDALFDAVGAEVPTATYEFRPFDSSIGHEELVILWDNRPGPESARFQDALAAAQNGLTNLAPAFRGQNVVLRPIPIVPRNAALRMQFSGPINATEELLRNNPSVVQLLEFKGDPAVVSPADAFRILPCRVIPQGDRIVVDTTILGGEGAGGLRSSGLPASDDNVTANIRLAIPTRGSAISSVFVQADGIPDLNGVDSTGRASIIRDFRSGNLLDGVAGRLPEDEAPMVIGSFSMGITAINPVTRELTLAKRGSLVPVRGRYPFVDGPLGTGGVPMGPLAAPIATPLRSGDILTQSRLVEMPDGSFETVTLRAEILQNLAIGTEFGGSLPLGRSGSSNPSEIQGQHLPTVTVKVASLEAGTDSLGRSYSFEALGTSSGRDCILRAYYYNSIPYTGSNQVMGDRDWRKLFLRVDPQPLPDPGSTAITGVNPIGSFGVEFSKPMDLDQVDPTASLVLTNTHAPLVPENPGPGEERFSDQMGDAKKATTRVVSTRLSDLNGDGTILRLQAPYGLYHANGSTETYAFHVMLGASGVTDLAGNPVRVYDSPTAPLEAWSVNLLMNATASTNMIGYHTFMFTDADEDGTLPGSIDIFGQFRLQGGRLFGAAGVRFARTADSQNLGGINRINRGECWDTANSVLVVPTANAPAPTDENGAPHPGRLYWQPRMLDSIAPPAVPQVYEYWQQLPQKVGRVLEPHNPRGTRMQMRYIEDDFTLDYREPAEFAIDVEQLYWSPFDDETVYYDVFDRYSMSLAHSGKRPDVFFRLVQPAGMPPPPLRCSYVCTANNSALSTLFSENVLEGTSAVSVFEDKIYRINPNEAFRSPLGIKYVPFPRFDRSYTWRDSRLVTRDAAGAILGLGGAQSPSTAQPNTNSDWTAHIDSPWVPSAAPAPFLNAGFSTWVMDDADFKGNIQRDHDPIALPLLVDFKVFPDTPANNGLATGQNAFQVALVGPPSFGFPATTGGYYDRRRANICNPAVPAWPDVRAQASGGEDLITGNPIFIDPANQLVAQPSTLRDAGLGNATRALFQAPARDGMLNWARADFVRKVSTATFGFFDTLQPQRSLLVSYAASGAASVTASNGFPDLAAVDPNLRISDIVVQMDPPSTRQPAGTGVVVELRGAESFANAAELYNPDFNQAGQTPNDGYNTRGNLLNPNYACEAYRYSQPTFGAGFDTPRVAATGLTRYVGDDQIQLIRDPATQLLPRYLNLRLNLTNNVGVTPPLSPSLRSLSIVYRLRAP
ncbi:MAG: hypothetical protein JNK49_15040 [Planctomycetes bacterium]|nr:hypothetical protein [Planctomycetota bacterium]